MRLIFPFIIYKSLSETFRDKFFQEKLNQSAKTNRKNSQKSISYVYENVNESLKVNFKSRFALLMYPEIRYFKKLVSIVKTNMQTIWNVLVSVM